MTLRVDAVEPPAPIPLEEARDRVAADWTAEENARRLTGLAEDLKAELEGGLAIADLAARLGRPLQAAGPLPRSDVAAARRRRDWSRRSSPRERTAARSCTPRRAASRWRRSPR